MTRPPACRCYVLTPPGTGAIGLIRVYGCGALDVVAGVFQASNRTSTSLTADSLARGRLRYGWIVDGGERIDDVLISLAYTERGLADIANSEVVDITAHGGIRIIERILSALAARGVVVSPQPAASAVWQASNQIEAEVLDALVSAKTERAALFLSGQRQHLVSRLRQIIKLVASEPDKAKLALENLLSRFVPARTLVEGATVGLIGPPNSGKSTLFNALLGREGALVSSSAGTTRDWVVGHLDVGGVPIDIIDTAGRRDTSEALENLAIASGRYRVATTNLTVLVLDASAMPSSYEAAVEPFAPCHGDMVVAMNKVDLLTAASPTDSSNECPGEWLGGTWQVQVSALKSVGLDALLQLLLMRLNLVNFDGDSPAFFTERQQRLARQAQELLDDPRCFAEFVEEKLIGPALPIERSR